MKKITRRFEVLVLLLAMLLQLGSFAYAADGITAGYVDVLKGSWYYEAVMEQTANGILNGYPDGSFAPQKAISVGELITLLCRINRCALASSANGEHWAYSAFEYAKTAGWLNRIEAKAAGADLDESITRKLAVKLMLCAFGVEAPTKAVFLKNPFADIVNDGAPSNALTERLNYVYEDYILTAYHMGLVNGTSETSFDPDGVLTRAQIAQLLFNAQSVEDFNVPEIQEFDIRYEGAEENREIVMKRVAWCFLQMPRTVRNTIKAENLSIVITDQKSNYDVDGTEAVALYYTKEECIKLFMGSFGIGDRIEDVLIHELGHFVWFNMVSKLDRTQIEELSTSDEAEEIAKAIGRDYCMTDVLEFFAELFAYLVDCNYDLLSGSDLPNPGYAEEYRARTMFPRSTDIVLRYLAP